MTRSTLRRTLASSIILSSLATSSLAQPATMHEPDWIAPDPVSELLLTMPWDVKLYNQHITTLANPFFEGRAPGLRGNRDAANYIQFYLDRAGFSGAFENEGKPTYRQAFQPRSQHLSATGSLDWSIGLYDGPTDQMPHGSPANGEGFSITPYSAPGSVEAPITFVGYSIDEGPDGYSSYPEGTDLTGTIALVLRFEPMNKDGKSKWSERGWSPKAGLLPKLRAATSHGATGIIIVNAPGADDPRVDTLLDANGGMSMGGSMRVPVAMMSINEARRMVNDTTGFSLDDLRAMADNTGLVVPLNAVATINANIEKGRVSTDNVAGVLRGTGDLADEYIVIGAHYDHVGYGKFGTSTPDVLHPGADDNGSGTSASLVLAASLGKIWNDLPADQPRRSVMIALFSAEESGLEGSRYLVKNLPMQTEQIYTMINMDMVGRLREGRLDVQGMESVEGLESLVWPILEASGMTPVKDRPTGNSDHASFRSAGVPIVSLFTGYHDVYHTPGDVSETINRVGAVKIVRTVQEITLALVSHPGKLGDPAPASVAASAQMSEATERASNRRASNRFADDEPNDESDDQPRGRAGGRVRFGIMPGNYDGVVAGVLIDEVFPGTTADLAGLKGGDLMVEWNGNKLDSVQDWMPYLGDASPGDKVTIVYTRKGERYTTTATLQAADGE